MTVTKKQIEHVVKELVGEEGLPFVFFIKGKKHISEFIIAEELDEEIHKTRNILYRLFEHNIVSFTRKKDKIKGWYICYWDFNEKNIPYLIEKIKQDKIDKLYERLGREQDNFFYMCRNACTRMSFEHAIEINYKCPECSEVMHEQDNARTIEFLKEKIKELKVVAKA
jgi:transcription initiation factor TFIIE subunit alpha